jgi:hypothetical protein
MVIVIQRSVEAPHIAGVIATGWKVNMDDREKLLKLRGVTVNEDKTKMRIEKIATSSAKAPAISGTITTGFTEAERALVEATIIGEPRAIGAAIKAVRIERASPADIAELIAVKTQFEALKTKLYVLHERMSMSVVRDVYEKHNWNPHAL